VSTSTVEAVMDVQTVGHTAANSMSVQCISCFKHFRYTQEYSPCVKRGAVYFFPDKLDRPKFIITLVIFVAYILIA
jgi:hypothetical protein